MPSPIPPPSSHPSLRPVETRTFTAAASSESSSSASSPSAHATIPSTTRSDAPAARSGLSAPAESSSANLQQSDGIEMEPIVPAGHRRRRSSLMNPVNINGTPRASRPRGQSILSQGGIGMQEEPKISEEDDPWALQADRGDESFTDEDLHDDEETGLTKKDKRRKEKKRRRNTRLDNRIIRENITQEERKEADQNVVKTLIINGTLIALWYFFSLSISLYNKWMFGGDNLNFPFPMFTTAVHMLVQFSLSGIVLWLFPRFRPEHPSYGHISDQGQSRHENERDGPLMSKMFYLTRIGPCGAATGLDIGLGNTSLKFITLTFYTMCKSSSLAFVLIFAFLFRLESPTWRLIAIIGTMTMGVVMMVAGEVEFKLGGFLLVISAAFFSGFRWALTQILLLRNPATSNPFSSIFFLAPIMCLTLICIAIPVEGVSELLVGLKELHESWGALLTPCLIIFPGTIAFFMTASEFALLKRTSVVTLSIAGIFKEVVTISAAAIVFNDTMTVVNIVGLLVTTAAISAYNFIKIAKMRSEAQINVHQGHLDAEAATTSGSGNGSSSDSDAENDADGEEAGLLAARKSAELEESHVTADGDIIPKTEFAILPDTRPETRSERED